MQYSILHMDFSTNHMSRDFHNVASQYLGSKAQVIIMGFIV